MPPRSHPKAPRLSSVPLGDLRPLCRWIWIGIVLHTTTSLHNQTILLNSTTKDTMDSHIHSELACSRKVGGGTLYKKKKSDWLPRQNFFLHG